MTGLDVIKVSLTTIGGIGGTGYLVIKYRERASAESVAAEQRLHNAVGHLGGESPQIRIAGVYSLAYVADTFKGDYRQRVVNILCGYLRTKRGTWESVTDANASASEPATKKVYVSHDGAVESTVIEVLGKHLRKHRKSSAIEQAVRDDQLWCDCTIDLHGAILTERADFMDTTFSSFANFGDIIFMSEACFMNTIFESEAYFHGATIESEIDFSDATFKSGADFKSITFKSRAEFRNTTFKAYVGFKNSIFKLKTDFSNATFESTTNFDGTIFKSDSYFFSVIFRFYTYFSKAIFKSESYFNDAILNEKCRESIHFPSSLPLNAITNLPTGAKWARFDDKGNVIEVLSPE